MTYAIFDLDNCLANDEHRLGRINWNAQNPTLRYKGYHDACDLDDVGNMPLYRRVTAIAQPIFFTARPESVREKTRRWISANLGITEPMLLMRADIDHRPSAQVKESMLLWMRDGHGTPLTDIVAAYDDRQDVCDMYAKHGIPAHVAFIHEVCAMTEPKDWPLRRVGRKVDDAVLPGLPGCAKATDEEIEALGAMAQARADGPVVAHSNASPPPSPVTAADVLCEMATTYRERNKTYGDNFRMVAKLMATLFPNGVPSELVVTDQFHLFELVLVKLSRYAISNLSHLDSIHDLTVYGAMCEAFLRNQPGENT